MKRGHADWVDQCWVAHRARIRHGGLAVEIYPDERDRCWCCGDSTRRLQKCHIIPKMLGGSDTAENTIPLCPLCHDKAPDVNCGAYIFDWIAEQQNPLSGIGCGRLWEIWPVLEGAVAAIPDDCHDEFLQELAATRARDCGIHCGQHGQGPLVKASTIEWALRQSAKKWRREGQLSLFTLEP